MFFHKKAKQIKSLTAITQDVFGQSASLVENYRSETSQVYPFLSRFGANLESDYWITGQYRDFSFTFAFPLKLYSSEQDLKSFRYGFLGCILTVRRQTSWSGNVYAYSGKPFHVPAEDSWYEEEKCKGVKIFSEGTNLSNTGKRNIEKIVSRIESGFSAAFSSRYAVFLQNNTLNIVFWKPELYDFEAQLRIVAEVLEQF